MTARPTPLLRRAWTGFLAYLVKFGVVGLIGLVIDVALFNALRLGVFGDGWISTDTRSTVGAAPKCVQCMDSMILMR